MKKDEIAKEIYIRVASEIATNNEIWIKPEDKEGLKGWGTCDHEEIQSQLRNAAEFAKNAADIFEENQ